MDFAILFGQFKVDHNLLGGPLPMIALAAVAAFFAGKVFLKVDNRIEERRRKALELIPEASKNGLEFLNPFLEAYGLGDYDGLWHQLKAVAGRLRDEDERKDILDKIVKVQIGLRAKDPERLGRLEKWVAEAKAAANPLPINPVTPTVADWSQAGVGYNPLPAEPVTPTESPATFKTGGPVK